MFQDNGKTWNRLISATRLVFCRYLHVDETNIPGYIDIAAGRKVDRSSKGYDKAYTRVLQWKKNWFFVFTSAVETLQIRLEGENMGYLSLRNEELREAYGKLFQYELLYECMGPANAVVDWRATLSNPRLYALYKTVLTYSLV